MPATKITELTAISTINTAVDPLPIVDVSDTSQASSGTTKKITISQIDAAIFGTSGSKAIVVDNVASLKALTVSGITDGQLYITRGYYSDNDGGQGTYIYDSASSTADNGGTVIAPTSGTGRYRLQVSGPINIRQFGAYGNGSTDDTTKIQSALTQVSVSGGSVFVPAGIYLVNGSSLTVASNVDVFGEGESSQINRTSPTGPLFLINSSASNISFRSLYLRGGGFDSSAETSGCAIYGQSSPSNVLIESCLFYGWAYDVNVYDGNKITVQNCVSNSASRSFVKCDISDSVSVLNNSVNGNRSGVGNGQSLNVAVWLLSSGASSASEGSVVDGNYIDYTYNEAVIVRNQFAVIANNKIRRSNIGTAAGASFGIIAEGPECSPVTFTVNTTTNVVSAASGTFSNGSMVQFRTTGSLPAPLSTGQQYFVVNSTGSSFQVSYSLGGPAIDITTSGSGTNSVCIDIAGANSVVINANTVDSCDGGIRCSHDPVNTTISGGTIIVSNNVVQNQVGTSLHAISIGYGNSQIATGRLICSNNIVRQCAGVGIYAPDVYSASITGNLVTDCLSVGIFAGNTSGTTQDVIVQNNQLVRINETGISFTEVTRGVISGNYIYEANFVSGTNYGINVTGNSSGVIIRSNTINSPKVTTAIRINSSGNYLGFDNVYLAAISNESIAGGTTRLTPNQYGSIAATGAITSTGSITASGEVTANGGLINSVGNAGTTRLFRVFSGANLRWDIGGNATGESGSNTGSDFRIRAYSDAGSTIDDYLIISRANGVAAFNTDRVRIVNSGPPATATSTGLVGSIAWDANYIYVCTAANTWKRASILTW